MPRLGRLGRCFGGVRVNDWKARAEREAAALIAGATGAPKVGGYDYSRVVDLVALGWLQGAIFASHMDLQALEMGVDDLKAAL